MGIEFYLERSKRWREATKDPKDPKLKKELEQYYKDRSSLKCPEGLDFVSERKWYQKEIKNLQNQLSLKVKDIILARQRNWQMKLQSSHR